ncbi:neurogenic locus notch homolog protein 1 [Striga asiatica]|uniref:Neurogenic locus notch homolog protein 1 n=1 Tax=Striga asiatica TaxID=4170 RepID=A0A5A7QJU8_STRAF|nr:neurogenic locus notch homolog protein 1 [Striga asiatica]
MTGKWRVRRARSLIREYDPLSNRLPMLRIFQKAKLPQKRSRAKLKVKQFRIGYPGCPPLSIGFRYFVLSNEHAIAMSNCSVSSFTPSELNTSLTLQLMSPTSYEIYSTRLALRESLVQLGGQVQGQGLSFQPRQASTPTEADYPDFGQPRKAMKGCYGFGLR